MSLYNKTTLKHRKHPAHKIPLDRHNQAIILFVTIAVQPRGNHLANRIFHKAFCSACVEAYKWSIGKYVIMPDHVHFFCAPATDPRINLIRWVRYLKERITKQLGKTPDKKKYLQSNNMPSTWLWKWQPDCWDTQIRDAKHYHEKWMYVQQNPVRAGLVTTPEEWFFQGEINVLRW